MDTSNDGLIKLNNRMRTDASGMVSLWHECGRMCVSRKVQSLNAGAAQMVGDSSFTPEQAVLTTVASEANDTLAAGCLSWITPSDTPWFVWKPAPQLEGSDAVETWLQRCTEIAQIYLGSSNFYNRIHEAFLDRSTFGTACPWLQPGANHPLHFRTFDVGTFAVAEDNEGQVNLITRELDFDARQAEAEFGRLPERMRQAAKDKPLDRHRFLHVIFERPASERNPDGGPLGMRFASRYIFLETKETVREGGYEELPAFVSRYLRWSESSPYGASPAMLALAEIRGVNYLELLLATQAEVTVNPRIILPQGYQGTPDLRAGGITMGGMTRESHPQEWLTGGRLDLGLAMLDRKENQVREIFHRGLFMQFAQIERQITAAEVRAREAERLARFSPAFTNLTTETINPLLERVFMILFRADKFPPPPREALVQNALGEWVMLYPQIVQTSRMALALQALKKSAFLSMLEYSLPLIQAGEQVLDNFDTDRAVRDLARGDGLPTTFIRDSEAVEGVRAARAQAQQAAAQAEMMQAAMKSKPITDAVLGQGGPPA